MMMIIQGLHKYLKAGEVLKVFVKSPNFDLQSLKNAFTNDIFQLHFLYLLPTGVGGMVVL